MEEYSQDWVYMKNTYKMLINILNLRDRIVKRFTGRYNDVGELLYFGKVYLSDEDVKVEKFNLSLNYFPSVNEPYSSSVFNRGLRKLHDFCEQMLYMLKDTQLNIWPPLSSIYVIS